MGIRFVCHKCGFALHVKDFQAGKRGKCPNCKGSFRIPDSDSSYSLPLDESSEYSASTSMRESFEKAPSSSSTPMAKKPSDSDAISIELLSGMDASTRGTDALSSSPVDAKPVSKRSSESTKMPAMLSARMDAKWFVRPPSGGQFGPADSELLMHWISESRVTAESFLWREGMEQWQLATEVLPELFESDTQVSTIVPPSLPDIMAYSDEAGANKADLSLAVTPASVSGAVLRKRMKKRRQQLTMIIVLATVSLVLLSVLIFVLVFRVPPVAPEQPRSENSMQHMRYLA